MPPRVKNPQTDLVETLKKEESNQTPHSFARFTDDKNLGLCIIIVENESEKVKYCVHIQKLKAMSMVFTEVLSNMTIPSGSKVVKIRLPFQVKPELMNIFTEFIYTASLDMIFRNPTYNKLEDWEVQEIKLDLYLLGLKLGAPLLCKMCGNTRDPFPQPFQEFRVAKDPGKGFLKFEEVYGQLPKGDPMKAAILWHVTGHWEEYKDRIPGGMQEFVQRSPGLAAEILVSPRRVLSGC